MARNPQRGQAKALRRKKKLADRRKSDLTAAPRGRSAEARRAATLPLQACYVQAGLFETGTGMVILVRGAGHSLVMASFLIDAFALGVKDAMLRPVEKEELETIVAIIGQAAPLEPAEPGYARKLVRDAVAYARSIGLEPHADFAAAELLFGDIAADDSTAEFTFGVDGKPVYIPGPDDTPRQIRQRVGRLRSLLGDDGFGFEELEGEDLEDLEDEGYDPHFPPDPDEWLELDEDERRSQIRDYHEREDIDPPPGGEDVHAAIHLIVENRVALGDEVPDGAAVERLMSQGLDRHDAVHAIAAVTMDVMRRVALGEVKDAETAMRAAVEQVTAESWRRDHGQQDEE